MLISSADATFDKSIGWLGATDTAQEGLWAWDSGAEVTLNYWEPMQPDNAYDADCMAVNSQVYDSWTWDDRDCTIKYKSVCEMEL